MEYDVILEYTVLAQNIYIIVIEYNKIVSNNIYGLPTHCDRVPSIDTEYLVLSQST